MAKITVWETFFMLLTVIPVSKMLSSIFMKLVARVGTVDEDKWAMIGLGAIGATFGLMKKRGMVSLPTGSSGSGNIVSKMPNSPGSNPGNPGGPNPGIGNINANSPNTASDTAGGTTKQYMNTANNGTVAGRDMSSISQKGQRKLDDIINISGQAGNKAAGTMAKVGAASSFAVPEVAPMMAGIYAAAGKSATGFASTSYNLVQEIKTRKKNGQTFWQAMQDISGTNNRVAATTRVASALALSPLGSRAASLGSRATGAVANWTNSKTKN
ncbi:hypothetical protein JOC37_001339 [Desulfohalotomaculum tongense]|uniref:hypothetical protein n=1 Tax=Desulforadius tongensis TaxID=1216062 RepID=UPI00195B7E9B|nr:hypothetical protein [Desulforadius tongensis]MBM7854959.1 hypothetical protein [Desulforadius tongensis]